MDDKLKDQNLEENAAGRAAVVKTIQSAAAVIMESTGMDCVVILAHIKDQNTLVVPFGEPKAMHQLLGKWPLFGGDLMKMTTKLLMGSTDMSELKGQVMGLETSASPLHIPPTRPAEN